MASFEIRSIGRARFAMLVLSIAVVWLVLWYSTSFLFSQPLSPSELFTYAAVDFVAGCAIAFVSAMRLRDLQWPAGVSLLLLILPAWRLLFAVSLLIESRIPLDLEGYILFYAGGLAFIAGVILLAALLFLKGRPSHVTPTQLHPG